MAVTDAVFGSLSANFAATHRDICIYAPTTLARCSSLVRSLVCSYSRQLWLSTIDSTVHLFLPPTLKESPDYKGAENGSPKDRII
jgi:hypothetical protein